MRPKFTRVSVEALSQNHESCFQSRLLPPPPRPGTAADILANAEKRGYATIAEFETLEAMKSEVIPALREKTSLTSERFATRLLLDLNDEWARMRWYEELKVADSKRRIELLCLTFKRENLRPKNAFEEDIFRLVLLDPDLNILTCVDGFISSSPSLQSVAVERLWEVAQGGDPRFPWWEKASRFVSGVLPIDAAERILARIRQEARGSSLAQVSGLAKLAAQIMAGGGPAKEPAELLFNELYRAHPRIDYQWRVTDWFGTYASSQSLGMIEDVLEKYENTDSIFPFYNSLFIGGAILALARLRGIEILPLLDRLIEKKSAVGEALCVMANDSTFEAIDSFIVRNFERMKDDAIPYLIRFKRPCLATAIEHIDKLYPHTRFNVMWAAKGLTLEAFFSILHERELIPRLPTDAEVTDARKRRVGCYYSDAQMVLEIMISAGWCHTFLDEGDVLEVFEGVARLTDFAFDPRGLCGVFSDSEAYQIKFAMGGSLLTMTTEGSGWVDTVGVQTTVNRALSIVGHKDRIMESFHDLEAFIFGNPDKWMEIVAEYQFPLRQIEDPKEVLSIS